MIKNIIISIFHSGHCSSHLLIHLSLEGLNPIMGNHFFNHYMII
jgi:hypothetical protein